MDKNIVVDNKFTVNDLNAVISIDLYRGVLTVTIAIDKLYGIFIHSFRKNGEMQVYYAAIKQLRTLILTHYFFVPLATKTLLVYFEGILIVVHVADVANIAGSYILK